MRSAAGPPKSASRCSPSPRARPHRGRCASPMSFSIVALSGHAGVVRLDGQVDHAAVDRDVLHHPSDTRSRPIGILHPAERGEDVLVCQLVGHGRLGATSMRGRCGPLSVAGTRRASSGEPVEEALLAGRRPPAPAGRSRRGGSTRSTGTRRGARPEIVERPAGARLRHVAADGAQLQLRRLASSSARVGSTSDHSHRRARPERRRTTSARRGRRASRRARRPGPPR